MSLVETSRLFIEGKNGATTKRTCSSIVESAHTEELLLA